MGVLKVKQADGSWRNVGCEPGAATSSATAPYSWQTLPTPSGSTWVVVSSEATPPSQIAVQYDTVSATGVRTNTATALARSGNPGSYSYIGSFGVPSGHTLVSVVVGSGVAVWTGPTATGRLKLWTGSAWVVEKCGGSSGAFTDDFNRADASALGAGWSPASPRLGQTATWGTAGNQARVVSLSPANTFNEALALRALTADVDISVTHAVVGAHGRLVLRAAANFASYIVATTGSGGNLGQLATYSFNQNTNVGTTNVLLSYSSFSSGDRMRVVASGDTIRLYKNGTETLGSPVTSTFNQTETLGGLAAIPDIETASRFEDFTAITSPPGRPLKALINGVWIEVACMVPA